jgi:hypothetical protein
MNYSLKATLFLVFAAGAVFLIDREERRDSFAELDRAFLDWLVGNAWSRIAPSQVTLVKVNPADMENDRLDPRLDWAIILRSLEPFDPKSVAIVPPLNWEGSDALAEGALHKRVLLMPKMALGATFGPPPADGSPNLDGAAFAALTDLTGDTSKIPAVRHIVGLPDSELLVNGTAAFTQIELEEATSGGPNGIRVPLLAKLGDKVVPSLILQAVMNQEGIPPEGVKVVLEGQRPILRVGSHTVPVDLDGSFTVYPGMRGTFPSLDFSSLALAASPFEEVAEKLRRASQETLDSLRANAVVIGLDGEGLREFSLPSGDQISRAELLAMGIATIQTGRHITFWPDLFRYASWGALALVGLWFFRGQRSRVVLGAFAVLLLYAGLSIAVFQTALTWSPPWPALGICAVLLVLGLVLPGSRRKLAAVTEGPSADKAGEPS